MFVCRDYLPQEFAAAMQLFAVAFCRGNLPLLFAVSLFCVYLFYLFIYSFFNVDNYRKNTVYNKNSSKMLIDINTLVKKRKQNY